MGQRLAYYIHHDGIEYLVEILSVHRRGFDDRLKFFVSYIDFEHTTVAYAIDIREPKHINLKRKITFRR